jgi:type IV secretion system protein VirB9
VRSFFLLALILGWQSAAAQIVPRAGNGDRRLQIVEYDPVQVVQLRGQRGYQMTIELAPDEDILNVAVGDAGAWQVSVNKERNRLFLKPNQSPLPTNMTVITTARVYNFELLSEDSYENAAYTVRFEFPDTAADSARRSGEYVDVRAVRRKLSRYRISGAKVLRPNSVSDDGERTYVSWPKGRDLPATYEVTGRGQEAIVDGMMRDDVLVIDRLVNKLRFRKDRSVAEARRLAPREERR